MKSPLLHTAAWIVWLVAVLVVVGGTRNPWYIGLALLWVAVVSATVRPESTLAPRQLVSPWRLGLFIVPVTAFLNALFVHAGTTVLFSLPASIPVLGGPVTLEALLYGALNGVVLTVLFAAFAVFNRVTPLREIVRIVPRAYYPVAVTMAVALTFVPVTVRHAMAIREAQAVRGSRLSGLRGWLPLFLPLLSGGLERSMMLSEAMVARGFASSPARSGSANLRTQGLLVVGMILFAGGWILRQFRALAAAGLLVMLSGAALLGFAVWLAGREHRHTVYRPAPWRGRDWVVTSLAAATTLVFLLPLPWIERGSLAWDPYPTVELPGFSLILGVATWGLLGPALVSLGEST
jgi:energy-coupling factor transport system permease protein